MTWRRAFETLFGLSLPLSRGTYATVGLSLAAFKYAFDATAVYLSSGTLYSPLLYLVPILSTRAPVLHVPGWLAFTMLLWTLPFLWIGLAMTLRRLLDARRSPWFSLLYFVPIVNYLLMAVLCFAPTQPKEAISLRRNITNDALLRDAMEGMLSAVAIALGMVCTSVYVFHGYGASLFFGTPVVIGAVNAYLLNRRYQRSLGITVVTVLLSISLSAGILLLFALEGAVCILMAAPIALVAATLGAFVGRAIAGIGGTPLYQIAFVVAVLPFASGIESRVGRGAPREVVSAIEIDAPPDRVWKHVVEFSELPPATEVPFRIGIASPERAHIVGTGVGATRYCEFSTGTFVEPITRWEEPTRLSFDVARQPIPMIEWSPYRAIHPPHLDGYFRSTAGEFRLIALEGGRTRLEGSTWYELDIAPQIYWRTWADALVHRIHLRVLGHIRRLSERPS